MADGITQGAQANLNGKIGEQTLLPLFKAHGFTVVSWGDFNADNKLIERLKSGKKSSKTPAYYADLDKLVIKEYPYTTIYDRPGKTEFLVIDKTKDRRLRIEVKWQQNAGSVDEKYPYLWLNTVYAFQEKEIVLIVDGGGYKPGARAWLEKKVEERWLLEGQEEKKVYLMTISDFLAWANKNL